MEAIAVVVAFGLIFAGVIGLVSLFRVDGEPESRASSGNELRRHGAPALQLPPSPSWRPGAEYDAPAAGAGLYSEVDMLRAQVEHLRSEIVALSGARPERSIKVPARRYQTGAYTYLPRELRREVHKVRSVRHLLQS